MEESQIIKLITKEGKEIEITKDDAELSELLKQKINDYPDEEKFPINEVDEKMCERVKEYLTHFNGKAPPEIEKPLKSNNLKNVTDEWSANFMNRTPLEDVISLNMAANYMGINSLQDLCCAKIASCFKDKTEKEMMKEFRIKTPMTEEEKNKIREENKWLEINI